MPYWIRTRKLRATPPLPLLYFIARSEPALLALCGPQAGGKALPLAPKGGRDFDAGPTPSVG